MKNNEPHHDLMMVAWVCRLYEKWSPLAEYLCAAHDESDGRRSFNASSLRIALLSAGIPCILTEAEPADCAALAVGYADKGCCALVEMRGLSGSHSTQWHLCQGMRSGHFVTVDYCLPPGEPRYPGDLATFLTGHAVFVLHQVPQWQGDWMTTMEVVDAL